MGANAPRRVTRLPTRVASAIERVLEGRGGAKVRKRGSSWRQTIVLSCATAVHPAPAFFAAVSESGLPLSRLARVGDSRLGDDALVGLDRIEMVMRGWASYLTQVRAIVRNYL